MWGCSKINFSVSKDKKIKQTLKIKMKHPLRQLSEKS
jgi:hypothetical protein